MEDFFNDERRLSSNDDRLLSILEAATAFYIPVCVVATLNVGDNSSLSPAVNKRDMNERHVTYIHFPILDI